MTDLAKSGLKPGKVITFQRRSVAPNHQQIIVATDGGKLKLPWGLASTIRVKRVKETIGRPSL